MLYIDADALISASISVNNFLSCCMDCGYPLAEDNVFQNNVWNNVEKGVSHIFHYFAGRCLIHVFEDGQRMLE